MSAPICLFKPARTSAVSVGTVAHIERWDNGLTTIIYDTGWVHDVFDSLMIGRPVPGADGEPIFITAHADTYDVPADLAVGDAIEVRYPVPNLTTITKAAHAAEETS